MTVIRIIIFGMFLAPFGCNDPAEEALPPPHPRTKPLAEKKMDQARRHLAVGDSVAFEGALERMGGQDPTGLFTAVGRMALSVAAGDFKRARKLLAEQRSKGNKPDRVAPWLVAVVDGSKVKSQLLTAQTKPGVEPPKPTPKAKNASIEPKTVDDWALKWIFDNGKFADVIGRIQANSNPSLYKQRLLADAYYNLQKWNEAVSGYRKVLSKHPRDEQIIQYLADSLRRLKRFDESITFYKVLAKINPERPGFWRMIGDVARAKGDKVTAMWAYTLAVERGYTDDDIGDLMNKLLQDSAKQAGSGKR